MNPIFEAYIVGLVLSAGFSGMVASLFALHRNMAASLRDSLLTDE